MHRDHVFTNRWSPSKWSPAHPAVRISMHASRLRPLIMVVVSLLVAIYFITARGYRISDTPVITAGSADCDDLVTSNHTLLILRAITRSQCNGSHSGQIGAKGVRPLSVHDAHKIHENNTTPVETHMRRPSHACASSYACRQQTFTCVYRAVHTSST